MKKIELVKAYAAANTIHYEVREEAGLGLLQSEHVNLFVRFHGDENLEYDLQNVPQSILMLPISLYLLPITYFYNVELVIPEMDRELYYRLPSIYDAYSKIYGPFDPNWRGKICVKRIVENKPVDNVKYCKIVFFSGGVDACHAGINNPGRKSLLVSIPDIECMAKNEGPLREEKFSLLKNFSKVVNSDWLLISNNFNAALYKDADINTYLGTVRGLNSLAFQFDGWAGIKYIANMCCVAPISYLTGANSLIMGSSFEQLEDKLEVNLDGANPSITDTIRFSNIFFEEQDGLLVRRSKKVNNIINWCKEHNIRTKMWACFADGASQCGFCGKCIRTQLNILCSGENPKDWGFENFDEYKYSKYIKSFYYREFNPCWLWDNVDSIDDSRTYPYCNSLLHWLKKLGYKEYMRLAEKRAHRTFFEKLADLSRYPHYISIVYNKIFAKFN